MRVHPRQRHIQEFFSRVVFKNSISTTKSSRADEAAQGRPLEIQSQLSKRGLVKTMPLPSYPDVPKSVCLQPHLAAAGKRIIDVASIIYAASQ
jgi:hypothetical protein